MLAWDQYESGRALFHEFTACPNVFSNGKDLLHHILASGDSSQIHGYLIHSLRFRDSDTTSTFWQLQAAIIAQLRSIQKPAAVHRDSHSRPRRQMRPLIHRYSKVGGPAQRSCPLFFCSGGNLFFFDTEISKNSTDFQQTSNKSPPLF